MGDDDVATIVAVCACTATVAGFAASDEDTGRKLRAPQFLFPPRCVVPSYALHPIDSMAAALTVRHFIRLSGRLERR